MLKIRVYGRQCQSVSGMKDKNRKRDFNLILDVLSYHSIEEAYSNLIG
jgi:hypothetical protein